MGIVRVRHADAFSYIAQGIGMKQRRHPRERQKARGRNVKMSGATDLEDYTGILDGDANGDEKVDVADIVAIISHKKGVAVTGFDLSAADVNNDGKADEKDIELIQKIILGE